MRAASIKEMDKKILFLTCKDQSWHILSVAGWYWPIVFVWVRMITTYGNIRTRKRLDFAHVEKWTLPVFNGTETLGFLISTGREQSGSETTSRLRSRFPPASLTLPKPTLPGPPVKENPSPADTFPPGRARDWDMTKTPPLKRRLSLHSGRVGLQIRIFPGPISSLCVERPFLTDARSSWPERVSRSVEGSVWYKQS